MRILVFVLFSPFFSFCQKYEELQNVFLKEKYTRYYDRDAGVIIQKVENDSREIRFELALFIFSRGREATDFLTPSSVIVFEDKSTIVMTDQIYINYFQEGKHQYSVKHILTESELDQLRQKKIDFVIIADRKNSFNRWQNEAFRKACISIEEK